MPTDAELALCDDIALQVAARLREPDAITEFWLSDELCPSVRTRNCFVNNGIRDYDDLSKWTERDLLLTPNFGQKSLNEVRYMMRERGLTLRGNVHRVSRLARMAAVLRSMGWTVTEPNA